jgi:mannose-1-phosphate guanylyltransferase
MPRDRTLRAAIVLAGGEGERLRPLVERLRGRHLPKQYIPFAGEGSLIERAWARAARAGAAERTVTVVARRHLRIPEARALIASLPPDTVVSEPEPRGTAPAVLLALARLGTAAPDMTVALFPSDHVVRDEALFAEQVDLAHDAAAASPRHVVLVAAEPLDADPGYGYVVAGREVGSLAPSGIREVSRLIEKPSERSAERLVAEGALWSTMVMAFRPEALLAIFRRFAPGLDAAFAAVRAAAGTRDESSAARRAYRRVACADLSRDVLAPAAAARPCTLLVLPARGAGWIDVGTPRRLLHALAFPRP